MTQKERILAHFQQGGVLTPLDALNMFNCWSLAQVVYSLKQAGHDIRTTMISNERTKKHYASYKLASTRNVQYKFVDNQMEIA